MTLGATLQSAFSGLRVAQQGLNVTAHNVSNANTEGYTRKVLGQQARLIGGQGQGVEATELSRITDRFLLEEARRQRIAVGQSDVVARYHERVQDLLGAPGENRDLGVQIGELAAAVDGFANSPETSAEALEVVNRLETLGLSIRSLTGQVQRLRADADREIGLTVEETNGELRSLAELNQQISRFEKLGQDDTELLDQRDRLIRSLAEKIDISTYRRDDGVVVVQTGHGQSLADTAARVLAYQPAASVDHATVFNRLAIFQADQIDPATGQPTDPDAGAELVSRGVRRALTPELMADGVPDADQVITSRIEGGRLAGLLEARDRVLPALDDQLQELADGLRFALNQAHNDGTAWPPRATLAGTRTDLAGFAGATRSGTATIAVVDPGDGSTVTALQIDLGAVADETALAAGIDAGLGALGTAGIGADGNLRIALADPSQGLAISEGDSRITVSDPAGHVRGFGFSHYFGLNDLVVLERERPSALAVRDDIRATPARLSTARLDVETGPLAATLGGSGDNRAAQALADSLRSAQETVARGGLTAKSISMADYAAEIIGHSAVAAQRAAETAGRDRALTDALEFRADSISGVNLDEEMTRLLLLQKNYTASARVLSITDELFDELFRIAR